MALGGKASPLYADSISKRTLEKNNLISTLFWISMSTLLLALIILFPVIVSVNKARIHILSLFIDIPNNIA